MRPAYVSAILSEGCNSGLGEGQESLMGFRSVSGERRSRSWSNFGKVQLKFVLTDRQTDVHIMTVVVVTC